MGRDFEREYKYKCLTCDRCNTKYLNRKGVYCNRTADFGDPSDSCNSWQNANRSNETLESFFSALENRGYEPGYEHGRLYVVSFYTRTIIDDSNNQMYLAENKFLLEYMQQKEEYSYFVDYYNEYGPQIVQRMSSCLKEHDSYKRTIENLRRFGIFLKRIHELLVENNVDEAARKYINDINDLAIVYNVPQPSREKGLTRELKK